MSEMWQKWPEKFNKNVKHNLHASPSKHTSVYVSTWLVVHASGIIWALRNLSRLDVFSCFLLCKARQQCNDVGAWDKGQWGSKAEGILGADCEIELSALPFLRCNFLEVSVLGVRGSVNFDLLHIIPAWLAADHLGAPQIKRIWGKKSPLRTDRSRLSFTV